MAEYTEKLGLYKPSRNDDIELDTSLADNFQKIDDAFGESGTGVEYNIKAFGAVGNGTTDDTLAIQTAIDQASGKGRVVFPTGTYLTGTLKVPANSELVGVGEVRLEYNGVVHYTGNFPKAHLTLHPQPTYKDPSALDRVEVGILVSNVKISNITFDGNGIDSWGLQFVACSNIELDDVKVIAYKGGIDLRAVRDSYFNKVHLDGILGDGMSVTDQNFKAPTTSPKGLSRKCIFKDCIVENSALNNGTGSTGMAGWEMDDGMSDFILENCIVRNCKGNGFSFHVHTSEYEISNIHFINCKSYGHSRNAGDTTSNIAGFNIGQCPVDGSIRDITYSDCQAWDVPVGFSHHNGAQTGYIQDIVIDGGIWKTNTGASDRDATESSIFYVGKMFRRFFIQNLKGVGSKDGFGIYTYDSGDDITISNVYIKEAYTPLYSVGASRVVVNGFRAFPSAPVAISPTTTCIYIESTRLNMTGVQLLADRGNYTSSGIRLIGQTSIVVSAVENLNSGTKTSYGMVITDVGHATVTGCMLNNFENGIFLSGTGTRLNINGNSAPFATAFFNTTPAYLTQANNTI